jgi:hypothetical protein
MHLLVGPLSIRIQLPFDVIKGEDPAWICRIIFLNLLLRADYSDPDDIRFKNKIELCVADFLLSDCRVFDSVTK